jgi:hypothetical protein
MDKRFKNSKGQLSISNLMGWFILVIIGGILTLFLSPFIVEITGSTNSTLDKTVIYMLIPAFWIGIIATLMMYAQPQRPMMPY